MQGFLKGYCIWAVFNGFTNYKLLVLNIKFAKQKRGITDVLKCLFFLFNENSYNAHIALDSLVLAWNHHIANIRTFFLTVTVNSSVSLLEHHKWPRNIKMDKTMAKIMKVKTFRCNIRSNKNSYRSFGPAKFFNYSLLFHISHTAWNLNDLLVTHVKIFSELLWKELHCFNSLGENNDTVINRLWIPVILFASKKFEQWSISWKITRFDQRKSISEFFKQGNILNLTVRILMTELFESFLYAFQAGFRTWKKWFFEWGLE